MLVNGYHPLHAELEERLADLLGFESALLVGSGFLGNLALIDTLLVKNALLFMDEHYHASGIFSAKAKPNQVVFSRTMTLKIYSKNSLTPLKINSNS